MSTAVPRAPMEKSQPIGCRGYRETMSAPTAALATAPGDQREALGEALRRQQRAVGPCELCHLGASGEDTRGAEAPRHPALPRRHACSLLRHPPYRKVLSRTRGWGQPPAGTGTARGWHDADRDR